MTGTGVAARRGKRWIDHWEPEDPAFWDGGGSRIARRNLAASIFAELKRGYRLACEPENARPGCLDRPGAP